MTSIDNLLVFPDPAKFKDYIPVSVHSIGRSESSRTSQSFSVSASSAGEPSSLPQEGVSILNRNSLLGVLTLTGSHEGGPVVTLHLLVTTPLAAGAVELSCPRTPHMDNS